MTMMQYLSCWVDVIVGHLPREISCICYHFIQYCGEMTCRITGRRKLGKGLEVPCVYRFSGSFRKLKNIVIVFYCRYN